MKQRYKKLGIESLCLLFGKTRYAYYDACYRKNERDMGDAVILKLVEEIRIQMPKLGTRKLYHLLTPKLEKHGVKLGRDYLFDLLADQGMLLRKKRRKAVTTNSRHAFRRYPNMIEHLDITASEQVWVSDITYLYLKDGFCYLSLITDAYSRKVIGYCLNRTLESYGCIRALKMAIASRSKSDQLIHHSDRGIQYCCKEYVDILRRNNIFISMTQKGDPYENAIAERINGILKTEFGLSDVFKSFEAASRKVNTSIAIYNELRPHASCDYLTPAQAHENEGELNKRWKPYMGLKKKALENDRF